jgi:hypothetical protein
MADITINISAAQSATIPDDVDVADFVQGKVDGIFNQRINAQRHAEFHALTDAQKDTAITAGKAL